MGFKPDKLMGTNTHLDATSIKEIFSKSDDADSIAQRVLKKWDKNRDGQISFAELKKAASRTDGKISLSKLDPGESQNFMKKALGSLWELLIVGLVLYFAVSIINELAKTKQAQLDEDELAKMEETS